MKRLWAGLGVAIFWLSWPLLALYLNHSARSRVLVICAGRVLLVRGWLSSGEWSLPGGGVHRHESSRQAAVRELAEETGIKAVPKQLEALAVNQTARSYGLRFNYDSFVLNLTGELAPISRRRLEIVDLIWVKEDELATFQKLEPVTRAILRSRPSA